MRAGGNDHLLADGNYYSLMDMASYRYYFVTSFLAMPVGSGDLAFLFLPNKAKGGNAHDYINNFSLLQILDKRKGGSGPSSSAKRSKLQ